MEQYKVTGMSCAACVARVEKAVQSVPGVDSVAVSLLTNSMSVEGDASPSAIEKAVSDAGYGAFQYCDSLSEIVIPLHHAGKVVGVLDIDSPIPARFDEADAAGLQRFANVLERNCNWEQ